MNQTFSFASKGTRGEVDRMVAKPSVVRSYGARLFRYASKDSDINAHINFDFVPPEAFTPNQT